MSQTRAAPTDFYFLIHFLLPLNYFKYLYKFTLFFESLASIVFKSFINLKKVNIYSSIFNHFVIELEKILLLFLQEFILFYRSMFNLCFLRITNNFLTSIQRFICCCCFFQNISVSSFLI